MRESDYPQVLKIWQTCFGDEEGYVRFFWENCFPVCRGLCLEEGGEVASMLFLLPGGLRRKKVLLAAEYVYAVATLPEFRGRGYAAALAREAERIARGEGKSALCLRPADEGLYGYYAKLGYVKAFAKHERYDRYGRFEWSEPMRAYLQKEAALTDRGLSYSPAENPGGMLLPLDKQAKTWLRKTKGRACLGPALE